MSLIYFASNATPILSGFCLHISIFIRAFMGRARISTFAFCENTKLCRGVFLADGDFLFFVLISC